MTLAEWIKQVEKRLEKATPGPWTIRHEKVIKVDIAHDYLIPVYLDDDALLIANAPTDLATALKVIKTLIEALADAVYDLNLVAYGSKCSACSCSCHQHANDALAKLDERLRSGK